MCPIYRNARGSVITPVTADAAAVAGEPKNISTLEVPMRPRKFLLFVASTLSPSVRMPQALPQHRPQPG